MQCCTVFVLPVTWLREAARSVTQLICACCSGVYQLPSSSAGWPLRFLFRATDCLHLDFLECRLFITLLICFTVLEKHCVIHILDLEGKQRDPPLPSPLATGVSRSFLAVLVFWPVYAFFQPMLHLGTKIHFLFYIFVYINVAIVRMPSSSQELEYSIRKAVVPSAGQTQVCVDAGHPQCSCCYSQRHSLACWLNVVAPWSTEVSHSLRMRPATDKY